MDLDDIDDDVLNQFMDDFHDHSQEEEVKLESELQSEPEPPVEAEHKTISQVQNFPRPEHLDVLLKTFGHQTFRPLQWEIISNIIHNQRDVCAIMSTGYGKSLCFQFPSVFLGGITLVISPLISLMEDQVLSLKVANISACLLGTAQKKQTQVIDEIFNKKYSIIYLTPEFCGGDIGSEILKRISNELKVVLIAIDEAHCISSWGHDFRYHYRQLGNLRTIFTQVPIIATTATATRKVQEDIIKSLNLRNPARVCSGFDRPNIYFEVNLKGSGGIYSDLRKLLIHDGSRLKFSGPTIIYCITRKETERIAEILKMEGINCLPYHAGLPMKDRQEAHELFVKDKIDVIVGTIAFGMGIDKPDVRNVVHYGCSKSIENYYQEVGRSGRDGLPAHCVTFYNISDFTILRRLMASSNNRETQNNAGLKKMEEFLTMSECRRRFILQHFEDKVDNLATPKKSCCDICTKKLYDTTSDHEKYEGIDENGCYDFTDPAKKFLRAVEAFGSSKYGLGTFVKFIRGISSTPEYKKKHPLFGCGKIHPADWWVALARMLIQKSYLQEKFTKTSAGFSYAAIILTEQGRLMMTSKEPLRIPPPSTFLELLKPKATPSRTQPWISTSRPVNLPSTSKQPTPETQMESESEIRERMALYRKLLDQRGKIASELDCMPYMVASNTALMALSKLKPATLDELRHLNIDGFTEAKMQKFGCKFVEVITNKSNKMTENEILPIKEILCFHPLPEISLSPTVTVSCTMAESGLTIGEIAEKRNATKSTIASHLTTGLKFGYPIKMAEFGVTEESRDAIIKVYRTFHKTGFTSTRLTPVKEQLPDEISYDEIKAVLAYLQVRCHLESLNIPYKDFEDFDFDDVDPKEIENGTNSQIVVAEKVEEKKDENYIRLEETQEVVESPAKKFKVNEKTVFDNILDSPPRQNPCDATISNIFEEPNLTDDNNTPLETKKDTKVTQVSSPRKFGKSKKVLPPWLVVKKIS